MRARFSSGGVAACSMAFLSFVSTLASQQPAQGGPTLILTGGRVFTADSTRPWAEAIAIRGERILAVGTNAEIASLATPATRRADVGGRVVTPGFNDAHTHLGCQLGFVVPVSVGAGPERNPAFAVIAESLRAVARREPPGTWLAVGPIGRAVIEDTSARRAALDRIAPDNPVSMHLNGGHGLVLNTAALRALGLSDSIHDPVGGRYGRDATGRLNGSLREYAIFRTVRRLCSMDAETTLVNGLRSAGRLMARQGITSVQTFTNTLEPSLYLRVFRAAELPQRVRLMPMPMTSPRGRDIQEWRAALATFRPVTNAAGGTLTLSGWKWVLDGSPVELGILQRHAYPSRPGYFGTQNLPADTVRAVMLEARAMHQQLMLHAAGDSTAALVLSMLEQTGAAAAWARERVRIEHGPGLQPDLLEAARRLGVVVVQNPVHFGSQRALRAEVYDSVTLAGLAPLRSLVERGIPLAFGADETGEGMNPFLNIMRATTHPANPREALTREQAVIAYTRGSAFAEFAERDKGTLAPGMLADLVVLSQDIFTVATEALPATHSLLTIIGGRIAYDELTTTSAPPRHR